MNELVSVIIPVYKTEKYLYRCFKSVKNQTYENLEILLVEDGSPDNSGELCDKIAQKDKRVKVIHKENGGLSSARNAGIEASSGKYICFVDSDDYIEKDYVSTLYRMIKRYSADLAKINYIEVSADDYTEKSNSAKEFIYEGEEIEKVFLELKVDSVCVFMYRKSIIGETRFPVGKTSEDIPFNFKIFQKANKFVYLPINKYYYWYNPESISNGPLDKNMLNYLNFRKEIYEYYIKKGNGDMLRLSETQYARAAMGLMARMAFYGITDDMIEIEYKKKLKRIFFEHSCSFFRDNKTRMNRKILAVFVFYFYPIAKLFRTIVK